METIYMEENTKANGAVPVEVKQDSGADLSKRAVILAFRTGLPGNRRKVSTSEVEVDADKSMISLSKDLLDSEELKAVRKFDGQVRRWVLTRCLPSYFREGFYLLPVGLISEVDQELSAKAQEREQLISAFLASYPTKVEEARGRLRSLFNPTDYPSEQRLYRAFVWEVKYISFSVPGTLQEVNRELWEREQQKAERYWQETANEVRSALRESMAGLVNHLVDKLGYEDGGKPRIFRDSAVEKLSDFLETFYKRDITNDSDLTPIVEKAKALLDGVDPELLRRSPKAREAIKEGFGRVKLALDAMLVDRPARMISFDDD